MYLLGIDLGTTGCKSILFCEKGEIVSEAYIEYELIKTSENYIEQDASEWWKLVKKAVKEVVEKSTVNPKEIAALSISSQGISFVPVDEGGQALTNAISWLDTRAEKQAIFLAQTIGEEELYKRTGKRLRAAYTLPKILWIKENMPLIYNNTHKFLMGLDFITYKMTGKYVTDYSMASGTMAFNIHDKKWDDEILKEVGVDVNLLPEVQPLGCPVGFILADVAKAVGLSESTMVVLGAQDQKCAAMGSGINKGICTISLGTATAISTISEQPILDKEMRIPCFTLDKKYWIVEAVIGTSGVSLKWMKETFFTGNTYSELDRMVEDSSIGANNIFFYPHLQGATSPYWNSEARGFIYGMSLSTTREDMIRSLYEGIAFQIRANLEVMEKMGAEINEIRVFGGGSKSDIWCKIIADVTGKIVHVLYTSEIANLGAAIIAGVGSGIYKNFDAAISEIDLVKKSFKPITTNKECFDAFYKKYIEIQNRNLKECL